jgi:DNA-binding GntR family transcriptional regulator
VKRAISLTLCSLGQDIELLHIKSTNEYVYEHLLSSILDKKLKSGERLVIESLAKELGISTTPVRDAFRRLELEGLLEVRPRSGSFVKMPSRKEIEDVFQLRLILEQAAIENGLQNISDETIADVEAALDLAERTDKEEHYINSDELIHECIINALGNQEICNVIKGLWLKLRLFRTVCVQDKRFDLEALQDHRMILNAIKKGNKTHVMEIDYRHILSVRDKTLFGFTDLEAASDLGG